ncbi:MAG: hypothetical protein GY754_11945, partial [bacterium]|nr:hypothetical protein [bacterium]
MQNKFTPPKVKIAFFDLDGTLTSTDTDWLWVVWRAKRSLKGLAEIIRFIRVIIDYQKGTMSTDQYLEYHKFRLGNSSPEKMKRLTSRFFARCGSGSIPEGALRILEQHRNDQARIVLLTAQNELIASEYAKYLKIDDMIAGKFSIEDSGKGSRYTRPQEPYPFREGKVLMAEAFAGKLNISLEECAF